MCVRAQVLCNRRRAGQAKQCVRDTHSRDRARRSFGSLPLTPYVDYWFRILCIEIIMERLYPILVRLRQTHTNRHMAHAPPVSSRGCCGFAALRFAGCTFFLGVVLLTLSGAFQDGHRHRRHWPIKEWYLRWINCPLSVGMCLPGVPVAGWRKLLLTEDRDKTRLLANGIESSPRY